MGSAVCTEVYRQLVFRRGWLVPPSVGYYDRLYAACAPHEEGRYPALRVYFTGSNLWLLTGYSGYDPEVDVQKGLTPGVDYNKYPRSRGYMFGVNLSF